MKNVKTSMFNDQRSYVYNKAFARYLDNNDAHDSRVVTVTGGSPKRHKIP